MFKSTFYFIFGTAVCGLALVASTGFAQERTAGSAMDAQMTWTALSNLANAASAKADAVNTRVDQIVLCGRKGLVYAPGQSGADGEGCVTAIVPPPTLVTDARIDHIIACGVKGMVFAPGNAAADAGSCLTAGVKAQNWVDVSGQRTLNGVYRNTTGAPITLFLDVNYQPVLEVSRDGNTWLATATMPNGGRSNNTVINSTLVVPNGYYYRLAKGHPNQDATFYKWLELR